MSVKSQIGCPRCGQQYRVGDEMTGQTLRCTKCNTSFLFSGKPSVAGRSQLGRSTTAHVDATRDETVKKPVKTPPSKTAEGMPATIGPFQIRKVLGQGAFGVVYLAYHPFLDIQVAVKMLRTEAKSSSQAVERFQREAKILAKMDHANVLRVYDAGQHGKDYYLASAYIPGRDLAAVVPEGGMEPRRAVQLTLQMLRGLGYAHALGIVHRDVKPANARLNDQDTLFLMDFGMAGWAVQEVAPEEGKDAMRLTRAGAVIGTPAYMAPEQASGMTAQAGPEADLYSAGVVFYELLTGKLPFEATNLPALLYAVVNVDPLPPSQLRPELDPRFDAICLKALAKRPEDRFSTAEEFAAALEEWSKQADGSATASTHAGKASRSTVSKLLNRETRVGGVAVPPRPIAPIPEPVTQTQPSSLKLWILGGVFAVFVLIVLVAVLLYFLASRSNQPTRRGFFQDRDEYKAR